MDGHVLVPVDGSQRSDEAVEFALERMTPSHLTVLHVINPVGMLGYADDETFDVEAYQQEEKRRHRRGEELLDGYRERATEQRVEVDTVLLEGSPAKRILECAEDREVDHIVMGSRGRSGVGRILLGSVAETVTRRAAVPVTIVR